MKKLFLLIALLATGVFAGPITSVPAGGWQWDSYYIVTQGTRAQIKTYLQNNGVNVARVREFFVGDVQSAPVAVGEDSVRCTRKFFVIADGYRCIEIDRRLMARWGDKIVALVNDAPNTYLFTIAETRTRIAAATERSIEEISQ